MKGFFSSASSCLPLTVSSKAWRCKGYGVNTMLACTLAQLPGLMTSCMQLREGGQAARCVCQEAGLQEICYQVIMISLDSQNSLFFKCCMFTKGLMCIRNQPWEILSWRESSSPRSAEGRQLQICPLPHISF